MVTIWLVGVAGMAAHWAKRWARGQSDATFVEYFVIREPRKSVAAAAAMAAAVATFLATWDGQLTGQALATVFLAGYAADSAANGE